MKENKSRIEIVRKVLKHTVKISDLFKEYKRFIDPVWRTDGEYMICCPFHGDLSPSLGINDKSGQWNCFGCSAKGDAVTALQWLARTVDHSYYSYSEAIDELIKRVPLLRESLPFSTVHEHNVSMEDILNRPKLKYKDSVIETPKTMADVGNYMRKTGKTSFIDVAYVTSMMIAKQDPDQLLIFLGAGSHTSDKTGTEEISQSEETAADIFDNPDNWGI